MKRSLLLLPLLALGCSPESFTPFNEVDRLRVIALDATKPWLLPSETSSISALVVQDAADSAPLSYEWSWCPLTTGSGEGFECAFTHEELQSQLDRNIGEGVVEIPPFELGTTSSVTFSFDLPPLFFEGACAAIRTQDIPDFIALPECAGTFPITIRLKVTDDDEEEIAIREIEMVYDDAITDINTNPIIEGVFATLTVDPNSEVEIVDGLLLNRETDYALRVDTAPPETYREDGAERTEELVLTWFIDEDAGEIDRSRTARTDSVDTLADNEWKTPKAVDFESSRVRMWFVLRDNRLGITSTSRIVELRE